MLTLCNFIAIQYIRKSEMYLNNTYIKDRVEKWYPKIKSKCIKIDIALFILVAFMTTSITLIVHYFKIR